MMIVKRRPSRFKPNFYQQGIALPLFAIALFGMLAVAGLGLDTGQVMLENTRLQNTLDAAALSGAKTLSQTNGDTDAARSEVMALFGDNANNVGNTRLNQAFTNGTVSVTVQFSNTLLPFSAGTTPARYVRVSADNFMVPSSLISILGFNETAISSTAVAGPSPRLDRVCNIAPLLVCGDASNPADPFFGFVPGEPEVLKASSANGGGANVSAVGPGNFQLVRLDGNSGGADVRRALAGEFNACLTTSNDVPTEPGNTVGPVTQGINTRFGIYQGPLNGSAAEFPPDVIVRQANFGLQGNQRIEYDDDADEISFNGTVLQTEADLEAAGLYTYQDYLADLAAGNLDNQPVDGNPSGPGAFGRRTLAIPIADCSSPVSGQGTLPQLGVLCFHLLQEAVQAGGENEIYGQFIGDGCRVTGNPGDQPNDESGPFIIQLYKDPDTESS